MSSTVVKNVGLGIIILGFICGVINGASYPLETYYDEVFNWFLMLVTWISCGFTGFLVIALSSIIGNLESMNSYLYSIYSNDLKNDLKYNQDTSNKWQCPECGTYNMDYSSVCKKCEHSRH